MSNIDKIRTKIKERLALAEKCANDACEKNLHSTLEANELLIRQYKSLLADIDSLLEEKPSEDLNKLIQKWDRIDINTVLKVKVKATGKVIDGFYDGRGHFDHFIDHDVFDRYSIDEVELMPDEEPSDELEEAAEESLEGQDVAELFCGSYDADQMLEMFKSGSEWQKKKDRETIELAEEHAILAGRVQMKEEMMKDAVEGTVICYNDDTYAVESCCLDNKEHHHHSGDKVKLIIVKED